MLPKKILDILKIFYKKVENKNIFWILSGSTSLVIQGVEVKINDIDIITDNVGSSKIYNLFKKYCIKNPIYSSTDNYRSYLGVYDFNGIKIDVMGDFQYRKKDGSWSNLCNLGEVYNKKFEGMNLPLLNLKQELREYENLGRTDKVEAIKKVLI